MVSALRILVMTSAFITICSASQCNQSTMYPLPDVCVADMIKGSYPACGKIGLTFERRICELRDISDVRSLWTMATLVGQVSLWAGCVI